VPDFLVWGAGGHAKVVVDVIRATGNSLVGYIDADPEAAQRWPSSEGSPVIVPEVEFLRRLGDGGALPAGADAVALGIGDNQSRLRSCDHLDGVATPALIHPAATVSPSARIGPGTVVMPGAIINASATIGAAVIVNTAAVVEHDCVIEDGSHLSPGSVLGGGVHVGRATWIGVGAVVIQEVRIGPAAVVGAGAVVIRSVAAGDKVAGVPARSIRSRGLDER
jgi:sugar O-acyltransferase (sialic acid O-acetyltransferase NeuD family)